MKDMEQVRWGMIGAGAVTEYKNGPGLYLARNSVLAGLAARNPEHAAAWVRRHGHGRAYPDADALLADEGIDIVYIATPPASHKELAIKTALAGKHCYLEKPIALSLEDGLVIQEFFRKAGKRIWVAHYRRGMSRYRYIKEVLDSGQIGSVIGGHLIRTQEPLMAGRGGVHDWQLDPGIAGGGAFFEGDIHGIDLMDFLLGPVERFSVEVRCQAELEDSVAVLMRMKNNVLVSGLWSYETGVKYDNIKLLGTRGSIEFSYEDNDSPIRLEKDGQAFTVKKKEPEAVGTGQIQMIVDELLGKGSCTSTLEAGLRALKIADQVREQCRSCIKEKR